MTQLLIIGGSDVGIGASLRARELDTQVEITIALADAFPNYSICGLPFQPRHLALPGNDYGEALPYERDRSRVSKCHAQNNL